MAETYQWVLDGTTAILQVKGDVAEEFTDVAQISGLKNSVTQKQVDAITVDGTTITLTAEVLGEGTVEFDWNDGNYTFALPESGVQKTAELDEGTITVDGTSIKGSLKAYY